MINSRFRNTMKSDSGASIIFVLCVMMFFMIIGGSVLVAASTAKSSTFDKQLVSTAELYSDSLVNSITVSMTKDKIDSDLSLGKQIASTIAKVLLNEKDLSEEISIPESLKSEDMNATQIIKIKDLNIKAEGLPEDEKYGLSNTSSPTENYPITMEIFVPKDTYSFKPKIEKIDALIDGEEIIIDGKPEEPSKLKMDIITEIKITVTYGGKNIKQKMTYYGKGIEIVGDTSDTKSDNLGEWRLEKVEKIS